jgi:2-keto-3-deoxy-L-rhamnonate aldolase RhmA
MKPFDQMFDRAPGSAPLGTWIMSASHLIVEATGHAGFDWAVLDMEHTPIDVSTLVHLLQANLGSPMLPIVRVPWNDSVTIKRVLDVGALTLLVPFVQNADEAAAAVAATRYPPDGVRGMAAMGRASRFGTVANHFVHANTQVSVIVQIETPTALENLEAIAAVPGVDALFLGPGDLSGALGVPGQTGHPQVTAAMEDAARRARAAGVRIGTVMGAVEQVAHFRAAGYHFVGLASDLGLYMRACTGGLKQLRDSAPMIEGNY